MGALTAVSMMGYCNVEVWGSCGLFSILSNIFQYPSEISRAGELSLGCLEGLEMILTTLPRSKILGVPCSITT